MSRAAILVLGMHRSGTSALTWLLGRLGAALPSDAIAASGDNARGYWESQALVKADDQLLRVLRSSWFDPRPLDFSRLSADGLRSRKSRIREAIEDLGCAYLPAPAAARDADGFLRLDFAADPTHGNEAYGELLIRAIEAA